MIIEYRCTTTFSSFKFTVSKLLIILAICGPEIIGLPVVAAFATAQKRGIYMLHFFFNCEFIWLLFFVLLVVTIVVFFSIKYKNLTFKELIKKIS